MAERTAKPRVLIELTAAQQEQVKQALGISVNEVELDPAALTPELLEERVAPASVNPELHRAPTG